LRHQVRGAEATIRNASIKDLYAECFITVAASLELPAVFHVGQGSRDLYAEFTTQATKNLHAEFTSQATANIYANFTTQAIKKLYAKFTTQVTLSIKGFLIARNQGSKNLKCSAVIRHAAVRDLKVEFIPLPFGIESLKASAIIRNAAAANLLAYIRCLHCRGLKAIFTVRHSSFVRRRIYTKLKVRQTPAPIELTAEFIVTRKNAENLNATFVMSTVNAALDFKGLIYVRPKHLIADSSRINGRVRKSRVRGGTITPVIAKTATTRIRGPD